MSGWHRVGSWAAALLLLALPADGQIVRGVVVADESLVDATADGVTARRWVEGAQVELLDGAGLEVGRTATDSLGAFIFSGLSPGDFGLRVTHPAFLPYEAEPFHVREEEAVGIEVRLGQQAIPLEPIIVTARVNAALTDFHGRRGRSALGTYITRDEVEARGAGSTTDLLRGMPGIRLKFVRWGMSPTVEMQGGFGPCEPGIFVDGLRMAESAGGSLNDYLTPDRIEGVEVYSSISTVPAQFQSGNCGVILFWTQRGDRGEGKPWSWWRMLLGVGSAVGLVLWIG